jgi:putative transposase
MLRRTVTTLRKPAHTYRSPAKRDRKKASDWAPWLCCDNPKCLWNGARDYAASLNIARLGLASLVTYHDTKRYEVYRMTDASVKPASYMGAGATLLLPSQGITPRPHEGKYIYYAGWSYAIALRTSPAKSLLAVLSTSRLRKYLLKGA